MNYYGIFKNRDGKWAWRKAIYADDVIALSQMRTMSLKKTFTDDEGKIKEKLVYYDLDYLICGKRVIYNG